MTGLELVGEGTGEVSACDGEGAFWGVNKGKGCWG